MLDSQCSYQVVGAIKPTDRPEYVQKVGQEEGGQEQGGAGERKAGSRKLGRKKEEQD